jgi:hypothetical protein
MGDIESGNILTHQNPTNNGYSPIPDAMARIVFPNNNDNYSQICVPPIPTEQMMLQIKRKCLTASIFYMIMMLGILGEFVSKQIDKISLICKIWYIIEFSTVLIYLGTLIHMEKIINQLSTVVQQDECKRFINTMKFWSVYCAIYIINFVLWWTSWYGIIFAITENFKNAKLSFAIMLTVSILQFFYTLYDEYV